MVDLFSSAGNSGYCSVWNHSYGSVSFHECIEVYRKQGCVHRIHGCPWDLCICIGHWDKYTIYGCVLVRLI